MKRLLFLLGLVAILFSGFSSSAQQKPAAVTNAKDSTKKVPKTPVVLGTSQLQGGNVAKTSFDDLLKNGIHPADGKGKVTSFIFGYKERNLYEDSVGNVMIMTDYMSEYCAGDTLSRDVSNLIYTRTKAGDTAYFDGIKIMLPEGRELQGKEMKFIIR